MNEIINKDIKEILESDIINWSRFQNSNILITGANGMLPSYLVFTLLELNKRNMNVNVYALVRNREKAENIFQNLLNDQYLHLIVQDVAEPIHIENQIDYVIHAASQASPKYYGIDPVGTINANVLGTINTLKLACDKKVKGYLYFSSGDVNGIVPPEKFPFKESDYGYIDVLNVRSCYAESKRMGENLCVAYHQQYNVPTKIVRIFHTFGPSMTMNDGRVFGDFCKNIVKGEDIVMNSDGSAVRLFCYVSDAIVAYLKVLLADILTDVRNGRDLENVRKAAYEQIYQSVNPSFNYDKQFSLDICYRDIPVVDAAMFTVARQLIIENRP